MENIKDSSYIDMKNINDTYTDVENINDTYTDMENINDTYTDMENINDTYTDMENTNHTDEILVDYFISLYNYNVPIRNEFMRHFAVEYAFHVINNAPQTSDIFLFGSKLAFNDVLLIQPASVQNMSIEVYKRILSCLKCNTSNADIYMSAIPSSVISRVQGFIYISNIPVLNFSPDVHNLGNTYMPIYSNIPDDKYRVDALIALFKRLDWSYVSIIVSPTSYDATLLEELFYVEMQFDLCLRYPYFLYDREDEWNETVKLVKLLDSVEQMHSLVLFTTERHTRLICKVLKHLNLIGRFAMIFVLPLRNVLIEIGEAASGAISIEHMSPFNADLKSYVLSQRPENNFDDAHFIRYYEEIFQCNLPLDSISNLHLNLSLRQNFDNECVRPYATFSDNFGYERSIFAELSVQSIFAFARTLHYYRVENPNFSFSNKVMKKAFVEDSFVQRFKKELASRNEVKYAIYSLKPSGNNGYKNEVVGMWTFNKDYYNHTFTLDTDNIFFGRGNKTTHGKCSLPCRAGYYKNYGLDMKDMRSICCWQCMPCPKHHVVVNEKCLMCDYTEKANLLNNKCESLPRVSSVIKGFPNIVIMFSLLGIAGVFFVMIFFHCNKENKFIKASSYELTFSILFSTFLLFLCPFLFLLNPSKWSCVLRNISAPFCLSSIYGASMLKIIRVYRVFTLSKKGVKTINWVTPSSQILFLFVISVFQAVFMTIMYTYDISDPLLILSKNQDFIMVKCPKENDYLMFFSNQIFVKFMLPISAFFTFKSRHFPREYHDAVYVNIILFVTSLAWITFYMTSTVLLYYLYHVCLLYHVIGFSVLLGLCYNMVKFKIYV